MVVQSNVKILTLENFHADIYLNVVNIII